MKERRINTMITFCAFTLTLSTLASASSHKIKVCRDICVKNERYVLLQKGIIYFACHRPNHDHGDAGETQRISRSNQTLETNAGLQCAKTRNSVLTNSIMKAHVNMGKMVQDALNTANRNPSQISHDQQTGRTIGRSNSQSRVNVKTQDAKGMKTREGGVNETKPNSSPLSKSQDKDTKNKGTGRGRMNETTRSSPKHSGVPNQDTKSKRTGRGRMNETTRSSPKHSGVPNHHTKSKRTERERMNETTRSGVPNHNTKSKGIARGRMYYTKPSSPSRKSAIKQDSKRRRTERGRMNESTTSPSQGIGIHSQNITRTEPDHLGISATVLKKQAKHLTVTQTISKSQPSVVMPKQDVNGRKTGDDNVHQTEQIVPPSPVGYQKMTVGKRAFLVKKYAAKKTWEKALEQCSSDGGTLVKPDTRLKSRSLIKKYAFFKSHWIGLKDVYDNDTFFWTDGSPVTFSKWQNGQPSLRDPDGQKENCVDLSVNFFKGQGWNDQRCDKPYQFICEM